MNWDILNAGIRARSGSERRGDNYDWVSNQSGYRDCGFDGCIWL